MCVCVCVCVFYAWRVENKSTENIYYAFPWGRGSYEPENPTSQARPIYSKLSVIFFSYSGQMQGQYFQQATKTSKFLPNCHSQITGARMDFATLLTTPSSDPHNINTSSLLSIRHTAFNTAVSFLLLYSGFPFYPLLHLILFPPAFVTVWFYHLLNKWIHSCIHSLLSPFVFFLSRYTVLKILLCVVFWFIHFFWFCGFLSNILLIHIISLIPSLHVPFSVSFLYNFVFNRPSWRQPKSTYRLVECKTA